ncbi:hypothetical protein ACFXKF_27085 [Streptomyces scopuliridis]|uniref:hypothetical protein n=1 Tax=Streptomyces scopuliridis TaxID=452529 RepID=UPI003680CB12
MSPGEEFVHDGTTWLRVSCNPRHNRPPVRVVNRAAGELVRLSWEENAAFWQWAVVETLRPACAPRNSRS